MRARRSLLPAVDDVDATTQALALLFRSVFVAGVGWFLVRQLRLREAMEQELIRAKNKAEAASP